MQELTDGIKYFAAICLSIAEKNITGRVTGSVRQVDDFNTVKTVLRNFSCIKTFFFCSQAMTFLIQFMLNSFNIIV